MISSASSSSVARRAAMTGRLGRATTRRSVSNAVQRSKQPAALTLRRWLAQQRFYSTEKIIQLRSGKPKDQLPRALYNAADEKENCGVGLIASLKSAPSRDIVEKADEMLVRMSHRGGCGCDPASGDGSGAWLRELHYFDHTMLSVKLAHLSFPCLAHRRYFIGHAR